MSANVLGASGGAIVPPIDRSRIQLHLSKLVARDPGSGALLLVEQAQV
jgi:hypothetical protein